MTEVAEGLRERKKRATRAALSAAALRLSAERGMDNVTIEEIAQAVDVSTRTFFNYFSSKEEAIMADNEQRAEKMYAALLARPAGEPIMLGVRNAVLAVLDEIGEPSREWAEQVRLVHKTPSLLPHQMAANAEVERGLARVIAERTGVDPEESMHPALVAASAGMAVRVAAERWIDGRGPRSLAELIREAMDQLARGLPTPDR
ncbi:MAG: TetR family transcriptional regulator [Sciscionella sp.]